MFKLTEDLNYVKDVSITSVTSYFIKNQSPQLHSRRESKEEFILFEICCYSFHLNTQNMLNRSIIIVNRKISFLPTSFGVHV